MTKQDAHLDTRIPSSTVNIDIGFLSLLRVVDSFLLLSFDPRSRLDARGHLVACDRIWGFEMLMFYVTILDPIFVSSR